MSHNVNELGWAQPSDHPESLGTDWLSFDVTGFHFTSRIRTHFIFDFAPSKNPAPSRTIPAKEVRLMTHDLRGIGSGRKPSSATLFITKNRYLDTKLAAGCPTNMHYSKSPSPKGLLLFFLPEY